jgi:hypothetical protein
VQTPFLEDTWLDDTPLDSFYPNLFNIIITKEVTAADVLSQAPLNIRFNRMLTGDKWDSGLTWLNAFYF